jgi:hypothetical protein
MRLLRCSGYVLLPLSLLLNTGCGESDKTGLPDFSKTDAHGHDHGHDHGHSHGPESLQDALTQLTTLRDTMRDAFAANDQDTAHDPLHAVGHVLEAFPELARKEKVSAENQAAIETAVNTLMDAFGAVDKTMHGQEGSTYSEESEKIDAAMLALKTACTPVTETPATEAPATEAPATEAPATEEPATEAPATEEPAAQ